MMAKKIEKFPIEIALEKAISKISKSISWSVKKFTIWFTAYPKSKQERNYRMFEMIIGLIMVISGLVLFTNALISLRY